MGEGAAALRRSCSFPAELDNSCLPLSVFLCGVCVRACVCGCVHTMRSTCTRWLCVCMCLCVEYLFDLCHELRLIMSADRWSGSLFSLGHLLAALKGAFFQPVGRNLTVMYTCVC